MKIIPATLSDFSTIKKITHDTIKAVYPAYYPKGAVDFFLEHHCDSNIRNDISEGIVYLLFDDVEIAAGTVTVRHNDIGRLFVLPEYQGRALLKLSLQRIMRKLCWIRHFRLRGYISKKAIYSLNTTKSKHITAIFYALTLCQRN